MKQTVLIINFLILTTLLFATPQEDFLLALRQSRLSDASVYLRSGGDIDELIKEGQSPLILMCREERGPVVRWLLEEGADPDMPDRTGITPLMHAARNGSRDITQILLLAGARINLQDFSGNTAMQIAVNHCRWELADYLESRGGRITEGYYEHPVLSEIWSRRQYYREALLLTEKRWPAYPFLKAVRDGDYKGVAAMLEEGSSPGAADSLGVTALMLSASLENRYISSLLLEKGADPEAVDSMGMNALWYAAFQGREELISELLDRELPLQGAYLEISPLFAAFAGRQYETFQFLLENGADPRQKGRLGASLVHYASFNGDMQILRILDREGVSLKISDGDGKTALDYLIQGFLLSEREEEYLPPARLLKVKKVSYTIDPQVTGSVKLEKIVSSLW